MTGVLEITWIEICGYDDLLPERGVRALHGENHVAVFRTHEGAIYAVSDVDPFSGASVLSRGIVGTRGDAVVVTSPMYKHVFDLRSGQCLDDPTVSIATYRVRVMDTRVQIGSP